MFTFSPPLKNIPEPAFIPKTSPDRSAVPELALILKSSPPELRALSPQYKVPPKLYNLLSDGLGVGYCCMITPLSTLIPEAFMSPST